MPDLDFDDSRTSFAAPGDSSGGQVIKVLNPPTPRVSVTGSWSDPYFQADEGQDGTALQAALAIRDHWASNKGGVYAVDPKTIGMEHGIDIGQQMQDSIDQGGYMRGVLAQAVKSGRSVPFDSAKWGLKPFNDFPMPDGLTVGRWGGFVQGSLFARPDGTWSASAGLWPQKAGQYDFTEDGTGGPLNKAFTNGEIWTDKQVSPAGTPFWMNFNRVYNFRANGKYNQNGF